MKIKDVLYKKTLVRVGPEEMKGVTRLIEDGYHGLAEKHTVAKLFDYIEKLESKVGISVPNPDRVNVNKRFIKINTAGGTYFAPSTA